MRRHYRNHTTPGAPRGSGAARSAGAPQPTRIPPPPHSGTQRERGPTPRATKSGPSSEDEDEFDELDSDMDVDPHPRTSGNAYPTPPNSYPSHSASPRLHPARSSPPPHRRGGASRSPSYSPGERGHPYLYSPPQSSVPRPDFVHARYHPIAGRDKGYADPPYVCHREYSPQSSNGSPSSHSHHLSDRREYAYDDDDDNDEGKPIAHRRRPITPGSSFHSSSPSPSVGGDDVHESGNVKKEYQYNPSRPYEDAVKDARVSTTLRRAVY